MSLMLQFRSLAALFVLVVHTGVASARQDSLTKEQATREAASAWQSWAEAARAERRDAWDKGEVAAAGRIMKFQKRLFGEKPAGAARSTSRCTAAATRAPR